MGQQTSRASNQQRIAPQPSQNTPTTLASDPSLEASASNLEQQQNNIIYPFFSSADISNERQRRRRSSTYTPSIQPPTRRRRHHLIPRTVSESFRTLIGRGGNGNDTRSDLESLISSSEHEQDSITQGSIRSINTFGHPLLGSEYTHAAAQEASSSVSDNTPTAPIDIATRSQTNSDIPNDTNDSNDFLLNDLNLIANDIFRASSNRFQRSTTRPRLSTRIAGRANSFPSSYNSAASSSSIQDNASISNNNASTTDDNEISFEHQTEMLSRLLEVAATSTVLTLMGSTRVVGDRFDNTSSNETSDSTFQEFVDGLRGGLLRTELARNTGRSMSFFRAFRFDNPPVANHESESDNVDELHVTDDGLGFGSLLDLHDHLGSNSSSSEVTSRDQSTSTIEDSQIPVMIIGVRSVQSSSSSSDTLDDDTEITNIHPSPNHSTLNLTDEDDDSDQTSTTNSHYHSSQSINSASSERRPSQRSWVIFVMGNTFRTGHPLLTVPTLFSDSPTYDDLLNLQELIGQVKPPVVSKDELSKHSDEIFTVRLEDQSVSTSSNSPIVLPNPSMKTLVVPNLDRCQICLTEYDDNEQIRKLKSCKHFFHKECIDEWLVTGRNNCPLCRTKGITSSEEGESGSVEVSNDN